MGDILKEDTIKKGHIALVDLDEKLLRETEEAVKELVAFSGQEFEVTAHIDYKEALPGTDYLFNTIATGGYERWNQRCFPRTCSSLCGSSTLMLRSTSSPSANFPSSNANLVYAPSCDPL